MPPGYVPNDSPRVAVVSGASGGIGGAIVKRMADAGFAVVAIGRNEERLKEIASVCAASVGAVVPVVKDLSEQDAAGGVVAAAFARFGALGAVVHAAAGSGVTDPRESAPASWAGGLSYKVRMALELTNAAVPALVESGRGRVVFIGGASVRQPMNVFGGSRYYYGDQGGWSVSQGMANAALSNFSKHIADEFAPYLTSNIVHPGPVATERLKARVSSDTALPDPGTSGAVPLRRLVKPDEVAALVAFLCSDDAAGITGQSIVVDGGLSRSVAY